MRSATMLFFAGGLVLAATTAGRAETFDKITITYPDPSVVVYRIDRPNVTKRYTTYPSITFRTGDTITIEGGGCVQTGGSGATWKRYVNPSGPDSGHLYYGSVTIPNPTESDDRSPSSDTPISKLHGRHVSIASSGSGVRLYSLRLGYVDDDYSDNGYYSHDDGTENQCRGVGPAFVIFTVRHVDVPRITPH